MPPVVKVTENLYVWTITLASGEVRTVLGSSLQTVIGYAPNIVSAVRGAAFTGEPAPPVATTLTPATATIPAAPFTLHVGGTGFRQGMQILWFGNPVATTYVSATELTTPIDLSLSLNPYNIPVAVRTLAGQDSNVLTFTLTT